MLGKLSLAMIPYHNPIIMAAVGFSLLLVIVVLAVITRYRFWRTLWRDWLCSVDHKRIGVMYILLALVMLVRGLIDAVMMRAQQMLSVGAHAGYLPPEHYNQLFSAHGTIMIFFMAMPFLTGLINIVVPLQLGKRDVAFPFMNALSLWLTVAGATLVMVSLGVGNFSRAGWTAYPPLAGITQSPDVGVDYWIVATLLAGVGSTMSGVNFIVTILRDRAPGMTLMRMPMFSWTALCTSVLMLFAFPGLTVASLLLAMDRYLDMHFFTVAAGGNFMNYINLFWIWGHPEVYILILPAFGVFSEVTATFSGKTLFGYRSLVYATMAIALLSFTVWLHHFFTMGNSATVNAAFGIATMIIAIPTGVKLFDWLLTMYRGRVRFDSPMLWVLAFIPTFAIGGVTGVMMAVPPVDFMVHNSEFLVAHFHNMLIPGALFGYLSGYMYWFPKVTGFRLHEGWGKTAFWLWISGFLVAFLPLYALGLMGMPRRMQHYLNTEWQPLLIVAAIGTLLIVGGVFALVMQLAVSIRQRRQLADRTGDPWDGRTLEWATRSPPPAYNFAVRPRVAELDAFALAKQQGRSVFPAFSEHTLQMPANTPTGFMLGMFAMVLGFAIIWHMLWLAAASGLMLLGLLLFRLNRLPREHRILISDEQEPGDPFSTMAVGESGS